MSRSAQSMQIRPASSIISSRPRRGRLASGARPRPPTAMTSRSGGRLCRSVSWARLRSTAAGHPVRAIGRRWPAPLAETAAAGGRGACDIRGFRGFRPRPGPNGGTGHRRRRCRGWPGHPLEIGARPCLVRCEGAASRPRQHIDWADVALLGQGPFGDLTHPRGEIRPATATRSLRPQIPRAAGTRHLRPAPGRARGLKQHVRFDVHDRQSRRQRHRWQPEAISSRAGGLNREARRAAPGAGGAASASRRAATSSSARFTQPCSRGPGPAPASAG
jgi:hypothetical protein